MSHIHPVIKGVLQNSQVIVYKWSSFIVSSYVGAIAVELVAYSNARS